MVPDWTKEGQLDWDQSRTAVFGTLTHVGIIEVCVVRHHRHINDPAITVLIRNSIRDLRAATPHRDHRSAQD